MCFMYFINKEKTSKFNLCNIKKIVPHSVCVIGRWRKTPPFVIHNFAGFLEKKVLMYLPFASCFHISILASYLRKMCKPKQLIQISATYFSNFALLRNPGFYAIYFHICHIFCLIYGFFGQQPNVAWKRTRYNTYTNGIFFINNV